MTLVGAKGLMAADFGGRSDPFATLQLRNTEFRSRTISKTLSPQWDEHYVFPIRDMADVLHVKVFDQDRFQEPEFLGRVAIPLLR